MGMIKLWRRIWVVNSIARLYIFIYIIYFMGRGLLVFFTFILALAFLDVIGLGV
jgi:hypothetical protein